MFFRHSDVSLTLRSRADKCNIFLLKKKKKNAFQFICDCCRSKRNPVEFIRFESQEKASSGQHVSTSCLSVTRELLKPKQFRNLWKNTVAGLMMSPRIWENCQTCPMPVSKSAYLYIVTDLRSGVLQQALDQPKPEPREPPWSYYICLIGCYSIGHMHLLPGNSCIWPLLCFFFTDANGVIE